MTVNLNQKEKMLLQDQKAHEKVCIQKYNNYANQTDDQQLKQMFKDFASQEQQHLNTVDQILNGNVPQMNQTQNQQNQTGSKNLQSQINNAGQPGMTNKKDAELCNDLLMTEKYVSNTYDNTIFEFADSNIRQALNHIQKEEQQHGEGIYNYMKANGMYNQQQ